MGKAPIEDNSVNGKLLQTKFTKAETNFEKGTNLASNPISPVKNLIRGQSKIKNENKASLQNSIQSPSSEITCMNAADRLLQVKKNRMRVRDMILLGNYNVTSNDLED